MTSQQQRVGVYPGSFDPITNGHMDIILRATKVVDRLIIGVASNTNKGPLFSLDERVAMVKDEVARAKKDGASGVIEVRAFDSLLMDFVSTVKASVIIRGLRAVSDFEYEFQIAGMNRRLNPNVEPLFLMASEKNQFIASRLVKEIGRLGGDVSSFVSPQTEAHLKARIAAKKT